MSKNLQYKRTKSNAKSVISDGIWNCCTVTYSGLGEEFQSSLYISCNNSNSKMWQIIVASFVDIPPLGKEIPCHKTVLTEKPEVDLDLDHPATFGTTFSSYIQIWCTYFDLWLRHSWQEIQNNGYNSKTYRLCHYNSGGITLLLT